MALSSTRLASGIKSALLAGPTGAVDNAALAAFCSALAGAIVAEVALATVTIPVTAAGLQTTVGLGAPTGPPAAPVPINGAIS